MLLPNMGLKWSIEDVMREIKRGAEFSECNRYRSRLFREWDRRLPGIMFIMLNPSTADDEKEDPTVRRCIGFATRWGYGWMEVRNIFSLRSTDPGALYRERDPIGPDNPLIYSDDNFDKIVLAWGNHGMHMGRGEQVIKMLWAMKKPICYFSMTDMGQPKHPLYLMNKAETKPVNILDFERKWVKNKRNRVHI